MDLVLVLLSQMDTIWNLNWNLNCPPCS
jgi:hypothetical protein